MRPDEARIVYEGTLISVSVERWGEHDREIVEHPGAVAIVAVDREQHVMLVRQVREAARAELLELPAGTREPGESELETARRELEEETGLSGGTWRELGSFFTTPGFCRERITIFAAEDVAGGAARREGDEQIELVRVAVDAVAQRLDEIEDAKTIAGLLLYLRSR